jgi:hypothetical protein
VSIKNLSSSYALFASPPATHFESEKIDPDLNQFKMHIIRFKRILSLISKIVLSIEDIVEYKYPKYTTLIYFVENVI